MDAKRPLGGHKRSRRVSFKLALGSGCSSQRTAFRKQQYKVRLSELVDYRCQVKGQTTTRSHPFPVKRVGLHRTSREEINTGPRGRQTRAFLSGQGIKQVQLLQYFVPRASRGSQVLGLSNDGNSGLFEDIQLSRNYVRDKIMNTTYLVYPIERGKGVWSDRRQRQTRID